MDIKNRNQSLGNGQEPVVHGATKKAAEVKADLGSKFAFTAEASPAPAHAPVTSPGLSGPKLG